MQDCKFTLRFCGTELTLCNKSKNKENTLYVCVRRYDNEVKILKYIDECVYVTVGCMVSCNFECKQCPLLNMCEVGQHLINEKSHYVV